MESVASCFMCGHQLKGKGSKLCLCPDWWCVWLPVMQAWTSACQFGTKPSQVFCLLLCSCHGVCVDANACRHPLALHTHSQCSGSGNWSSQTYSRTLSGQAPLTKWGAARTLPNKLLSKKLSKRRRTAAGKYGESKCSIAEMMRGPSGG